MRAIISGGGTGGHLYPALALIEHWQEKKIIDDLKYVGGRGIESKIVPSYKIDYIGFDIQGLKRPKRSVKNLKIILNYYKSAFKLKKLIRKFKPDFVFVTGGYASIPISIAAKWTGIPVFNQEQNVYVGFANRYINKFARLTFTNFEQSIKYFPRKDNIVVSGNPVMRKKILKQEALKQFNLSDKFTIGIFGGSGGSEKINESISKIYEKDYDKNYIHITGERDYDRFKTIKKDNVRIIKYCKKMDYFYSASDLVICRAGAMTVSELIELKKPAILIPHPLAAENHQLYNAEFMKNQQVAVLIKDEELDEFSLIKSIEKMVNATDKTRSAYNNIKNKDSLRIITEKILEVIQNER